VEDVHSGRQKNRQVDQWADGQNDGQMDTALDLWRHAEKQTKIQTYGQITSKKDKVQTKHIIIPDYCKLITNLIL
jgi:hypothetical protein